jgi:hypothetical protein
MGYLIYELVGYKRLSLKMVALFDAEIKMYALEIAELEKLMPSELCRMLNAEVIFEHSDLNGNEENFKCPLFQLRAALIVHVIKHFKEYRATGYAFSSIHVPMLMEDRRSELVVTLRYRSEKTTKMEFSLRCSTARSYSVVLRTDLLPGIEETKAINIAWEEIQRHLAAFLTSHRLFKEETHLRALLAD